MNSANSSSDAGGFLQTLLKQEPMTRLVIIVSLIWCFALHSLEGPLFTSFILPLIEPNIFLYLLISLVQELLNLY